MSSPIRNVSDTAFFAPYGWREAEFRSSWDESRRLQRQMPGAWAWNLLSRLQSPVRREAWGRMAGIVLLEPATGRG